MERQTVHLFVLDTLADWETGYAIAGINNPLWQAQPGRYQVATVGMSREPIRTIGGVTILPDMTLDDLDPAQSAMLILPGADAWDGDDHRAVAAMVRAFLAAGVPVAAICGATGFLARAGILDDRRHTSNAPEYLRMTGYGGEALYREQPAVTDGDLITASSTAPVDLAYQIFKRLEIYPYRVTYDVPIRGTTRYCVVRCPA